MFHFHMKKKATLFGSFPQNFTYLQNAGAEGGPSCSNLLTGGKEADRQRSLALFLVTCLKETNNVSFYFTFAVGMAIAGLQWEYSAILSSVLFN